MEVLHLLYVLAELRACLLPYVQHLHNPYQDFKHDACPMQSMPKQRDSLQQNSLRALAEKSTERTTSEAQVMDSYALMVVHVTDPRSSPSDH